MIFMRNAFIVVGLILLLSCAFSMNISSITNTNHYMNDYSGTLSAAQIQDLESKLTTVSKDGNIEIGIWLIDSTDGKPISDYALELGNKFGVGNKGRYDGVVILVAVTDRDYFISTAKGAETMLTDIQVHDIEQKDFDPNFKNGDFYTGLSLAIDDLSSVQSNQDLPTKIGPIDLSDPTHLFWIIICIIVLIIIFSSGGGGFLGGLFLLGLGGSDGEGSSSGGFGGGGGFSGGGAGGHF
jgi:uncharacterized protein